MNKNKLVMVLSGVTVVILGVLSLVSDANNPVKVATCEVDSVNKCAKIIIRKEVPSFNNLLKAFEFSRNFGSNFFLDVNENDSRYKNEITFLVPPGKNYTSTEFSKGYNLYNIKCVDPTADSTVDIAKSTAYINLTGTETVTCTFFNGLLD